MTKDDSAKAAEAQDRESLEVFEKSSSIQAIRAKEKEIADMIAQAEKAVELEISKARQQAQEIKEAAKAEGEKRGQQEYEMAIADAQKVLERLRIEANQEIIEIETQAKPQLETAADIIYKEVLP